MNKIHDDAAFRKDLSADEDPRLMEALREYQAALDKGTRLNRREFLGRHPDIRQELSECLDGLEFLHSAAPRFNDGPPARAVPPPLPPSDTIGDFHLVREIGKGGMGVVYEAIQLSLGRRVALKVLPFAATLDARQLQRFENEARAAAQLHHSNIVPVFAVGCDRAVHFYAMQLIDGRTLAAVIEHLRQTPRPAADVVDTAANAASLTHQSVESRGFFHNVAALGVQAAEALEYAHQMGVVHRDIKPANLLLDGRGNLWVTDFGLARMQSCPSQTAPGDLVGTLRYMSPEQAAGRPVIDPRSDVYSLGATLYELLTQRPAFSARDRQDCLRMILDEDPVAPHKLNKAVPPELETIVLKAMAKQPEDRYPSARAVADDLKRFLDDRPVQARRPGFTERAAKWARRHRRVVATAVVGLLATVCALAVTTWRVSRAEDKVQKAYDDLKAQTAKTEAANSQLVAAFGQIEEERDRAESNFAEARKVLGVLHRLGVDDLGKKELAGNTVVQGLRRRLLTELVTYYEDFIDRYGENEAVTEELIETRVQVAELLDQIGKKAEAQVALKKALHDYEHFADAHWRPFPLIGGISGPQRDFPRLLLLTQPAVQQELKLDRDQRTKMAQFLVFQPGRGDKSPMDSDKLTNLLRPEQAERLSQISCQQRGPAALLDPEKARALDLSESQKRAILGIMTRPQASPGRSESGRAAGGLTGSFGKRDPRRRDTAAPPSGHESREKETREEQILKVLNSEQREQWKKMLGEPFHGEIRFGPSSMHGH